MRQLRRMFMYRQGANDVSRGKPVYDDKAQRRERGQVSILIAIIFQVLFVFFAMVINVGLLVHDKINLQNSADIAAYYGAMKQAEVLNAMAHVNYQIRQAWKLFNYRLWVVGSAGRNVDLQNNSLAYSEVKATWTDSMPYPAVCVGFNMWAEVKIKSGATAQNLCRKTALVLPKLQQINLTGVQILPLFAPLLAVFAAQSAQNAQAFANDFNNTGPADYVTALHFLASYKLAVASRRAAMQKLQNLLIQSQSDFTDLTGQSVATIAQRVLQKNLTAANNNSSLSFTFQNSLGGLPFVVPREVRSLVMYQDFDTAGAGAVLGSVKELNQPAAQLNDPVAAQLGQLFSLDDYSLQQGTPETAAAFAGEQNPATVYKSLVFFEKNPWALAYVGVRVTSQPKMLFSPGSTVQLSAESFAMPFGARIGPWAYDQWPSNSAFSVGNQKTDPLLPPFMEEANVSAASVPNYSRFPGDALGMQSQAARNFGIGLVMSANGAAVGPHYSTDEYGLLDMGGLGSQKHDPLVYSQGNGSSLRGAEVAAVAPDLFDALYFSANPQMGQSYRTPELQYLLNSICQAGCYDYGNNTAQAPFPPNFDLAAQVASVASVGNQAFWKLTDSNMMNTSWTQESTDDYHGTPGGAPPTMIGRPVTSGGRSGYSVKIVSKHYLQSNLPLGGGGGGVTGAIMNPPQ